MMPPRCLLLVLAIAATAGCGRPGAVSGKVTYHGKPIAHGTVVVLASDSLPYTGAIVTGEYRVENVPTGPAKFAVISRPTHRGFVHGQPKDAGKPAPPDPRWFPIPEKYTDPLQSKLERDITRGENLFDLTLVGDPKRK